MTITLTSTVGTLPTPVVVLESSHDRVSTTNSQVHDLLDGGVAVTLRPGQSATGTLHLAYATRTDAESVFNAFRGASTFTYTNTNPVRSFTFITTGKIQITQAVLGNADAWVVECDFRELT